MQQTSPSNEYIFKFEYANSVFKELYSEVISALILYSKHPSQGLVHRCLTYSSECTDEWRVKNQHIQPQAGLKVNILHFIFGDNFTKKY